MKQKSKRFKFSKQYITNTFMHLAFFYAYLCVITYLKTTSIDKLSSTIFLTLKHFSNLNFF